ncbi:UNVERIFIED_CONTAM: hypothetical protein RF653_10195 [Kocuria sp. CPCC 205316]
MGFPYSFQIARQQHSVAIELPRAIFGRSLHFELAHCFKAFDALGHCVFIAVHLFGQAAHAWISIAPIIIGFIGNGE